MAFTTPASSDDELMNEINMTPLVDVMLVLLIIFIITLPVMQHAVRVQLPVANSAPPPPTEVPPLTLSVDGSGQYALNGQPVDDAALSARLKAAAARTPPPDLHIQGDRAVRYERVAQAMAAAQQAGLKKIGFITLPAP